MPSLVLSITARALRPLLLLFSIFLLLRGHNEAGGGFVGGLVAASAIVLDSLARGRADVDSWIISPTNLLGLGLAIALASGLIGLTLGGPFLEPFWGKASLPVIGKLGTPLIFDVGVYLVVLGVAATVLLALKEGIQEQ